MFNTSNRRAGKSKNATIVAVTVILVILPVIITLKKDSVAQNQNKDVVAEQKSESVASIIKDIDANRQKNSNISLRSITITATDPKVWRLKSELSPALLLKGRNVKVLRSLNLLLDSKVYADEDTTTVLPDRTLTSHSKYWKNPEKGIRNSSIEQEEFLNSKGEMDVLNGGIPTHYEANDALIPFLAAGRVQIAVNKKDVSELANLSPTLIGHEEFGGLDCLRLEFRASNKSPWSGYVLVCPSRDYKLLKENYTTSFQDPKEEFLKSVRTTTVEKLQKFGDSWVPTQVRFEWVNTTRDGQEKRLVEKFRLLDFEADAITVDSLFEPQLSPGTRNFLEAANETGSIREIVGGDISDLVARLQSGDMSLLAPEETDLSKP